MFLLAAENLSRFQRRTPSHLGNCFHGHRTLASRFCCYREANTVDSDLPSCCANTHIQHGTGDEEEAKKYSNKSNRSAFLLFCEMAEKQLPGCFFAFRYFRTMVTDQRVM